MKKEEEEEECSWDLSVRERGVLGGVLVRGPSIGSRGCGEERQMPQDKTRNFVLVVCVRDAGGLLLLVVVVLLLMLVVIGPGILVVRGGECRGNFLPLIPITMILYHRYLEVLETDWH